jgi:hypothetical protein
MDYLDFDLRISRGHESDYEVAVVRSVRGGEPRATIRFPLDEFVFMQPLYTMEVVRGLGGDTCAADELRKHGGLPDLGSVDEEHTAKQIGLMLFDAVFQQQIYSSYRSSLEAALEQGKGLRLRFRIDAPELAALPWEFLFEEAQNRHVCLYTRTPLTRYLELPQTPKTLTIQPPLRILGMVASPKDLPWLDVEKETRQIANAVELVGDSIELTWLDGATWRDLLGALDAGSWHIVHFIGHGGFDPEKREGLVAFEDADGTADYLSAPELGAMLEEYDGLRLVILNACEGARISDSDLYSSVGMVLMQRGIPAVISMQYLITDRAAATFAREFYDALARGAAVDEAVASARKRFTLSHRGSTEWATPVLHMRAPDGRLFREDYAGPLRLLQRTAEVTTEETIQRRPVTAEDAKGRAILLRRVRQYWIEGVFEKSLVGRDMIDLGMEALYGAVDDPWANEGQAAGIRIESISSHHKIAAVFDEGGRSLLILGEPGSGKTTAMLNLARYLVDEAEKAPTLPVPVVVNLSSWAENEVSFSHWMADELSAKYQVPRKIGQAWLEAGRFLPLLDGLDEVRTDHRTVCVEAINRHTLETSLTGMVICCRYREYVDLPNRLALNAAIRLKRLTDEQVQTYLLEGGGPLEGLRAALQREPTLRFDARIPLKLELMIRAYWGLSGADIEKEAANTAAARRERLMGAYVARMFRQARERSAP